MKFLFSFIISFIFIVQNTDIETVRNTYPTAGQTIENASKFEKLTDGLSSTTSNNLGYKAAAQIIKAKFAKGASKISTVKSGIKSLENVIKTNPNDLELRVIRLSIQENLPAIVGYKSNIKEDKNYITTKYPTSSGNLKIFVLDFITNSKSFSTEEKKSFK